MFDHTSTTAREAVERLTGRCSSAFLLIHSHDHVASSQHLTHHPQSHRHMHRNPTAECAPTQHYFITTASVFRYSPPAVAASAPWRSVTTASPGSVCAASASSRRLACEAEGAAVDADAAPGPHLCVDPQGILGVHVLRAHEPAGVVRPNMGGGQLNGAQAGTDLPEVRTVARVAGKPGRPAGPRWFLARRVGSWHGACRRSLHGVSPPRASPSCSRAVQVPSSWRMSQTRPLG